MGEDELRQLVKSAINRDGVSETARKLGLSNEATIRFGGGFRVHAGTIAQARGRAEHLRNNAPRGALRA